MMPVLSRQLRRSQVLLVAQLVLIVPILIMLVLAMTEGPRLRINRLSISLVLLFSIATSNLLTVFRLISVIKSPEKELVYHRGWGVFLYIFYILFITGMVLLFAYGAYIESTRPTGERDWWGTLALLWLLLIILTGSRLIIDQAILLRRHKYQLQQQTDALVDTIGQE